MGLRVGLTWPRGTVLSWFFFFLLLSAALIEGLNQKKVEKMLLLTPFLLP